MRSLSPCVRWMQLLPAVFVIIGCEDRTPTRWERISAPKYSVATGSGTWTARASMPTARERLGAAAINGILYAVGGQNAGPGNLTTVEAYDPATDRWTTKASMPTGRSHLGVAAINGILYAVGGVADIGSVPTVEAYDPATDTWTTKASMHTARFGLGVAAINGILYAVGGDPRGQPSGGDAATVEAYDPASDTWTAKASMPMARGFLGVAAINGTLYAVGGINNNASETLATVEAYNPATDTWTTKRSMPTARVLLGAGAINSIFYAVGGITSFVGAFDVLDTVEAYDPASDTWTTQASMPTARGSLGVGAVDGILYAVGGFNNTAAVFFSATVEAFEPAPANRPPAPKNLTVVPSGRTMTLTWESGGGAVDAKEYRVFRGSDPAKMANIASVPKESPNYFDAPTPDARLLLGTTYYYKVAAVDVSGLEGAPSEIVSASTPPPMIAPSDGIVTTLFGEKIRQETDRQYLDFNGQYHGQAEPPVGTWHHGADIAGPHRWDPANKSILDNHQVLAAAAGKVIFAGLDPSYKEIGPYVIVRHDGITGPRDRPHVYTAYLHMGNRNNPNQNLINVTSGMHVSEGDLLGCQGNAGMVETLSPGKGGGTHLHFEIRVSATFFDFDQSTNQSNYKGSRLKDNDQPLTLISPDYFFDLLYLDTLRGVPTSPSVPPPGGKDMRCPVVSFN